MSGPITTAAGTDTTSDNPQPFDVVARDVEFFQRHLRNFVPPGAFDAHGHLYDLGHLRSQMNASLALGPERNDWKSYQDHTNRWMGDRAPTGGLFFAFPDSDLDFDAANQLIADEAATHDGVRGLIIVQPEHDPDKVDGQIEAQGFAGIKVYHLFAARPDTQQAACEEFLPEWAWQIADRRDLVIMLHIVRPLSLCDPANQSYLRDHCLRYRNAKVILAHVARGFCSTHTFDAIDSLRGLDNVFFDQSTVTEPHGVEAVLKTFGTTRLLFALDYPISQSRGRCVNIADGFLWIDHKNQDWQSSPYAQHTIAGNECIQALRIACRNQRLNDTDVERIFNLNARQLLNVGPQPDGQTGQRLYDEAKKIIPGGTQLLSKRPEKHAPNQWPPYYREARGCEIVDLDGRSYIDLSTMSVGACVLGYADPEVTNAVMRRVQLGSITTLNNPEEVELAKVLLEIHPWADAVRYGRAGGEAMAMAVRIARAATSRNTVAFCGYHGWHDWYLATNVGPGGRDRLGGHLMQGLAAAGVPRGLADTALPFTYNRLDQLEAIMKEYGEDLAAVILETTRYHDPDPGFLEGVRDLCDRCGAVVVLDEITIGWKLCLGGSHLRYGFDPDMAVFAKSIGNGHPMAAVIGRKKFMDAVQDTFVSSSFWTDGVGSTAALATIRKMQSIDLPGHLRNIGTLMQQTWQSLADKHGLSINIEGHPALCHFSVEDADNLALQTLFTARMVQKGFLSGFGFHATLAHEPRHIETFRDAADGVFTEMAEAIRKNDIESRIGGPVAQAGFARLT